MGTMATISISARQTPQWAHVTEHRVRGLVHRYSIVPGSISLPEAVAPKNTPERRPSPDRPVRSITLTSCDVGHGLRRYSVRLKYHHPLRSSIPGISVASRAMTVDIIKRKMKLARVSRQHFQAYIHPPC